MLKSLGTEPLCSIQLYLTGELAGSSAMILGKILHLHYSRLRDTQLIDLVELYSGDGLKMTGCLAVTLGGKIFHSHC